MARASSSITILARTHLDFGIGNHVGWTCLIHVLFSILRLTNLVAMVDAILFIYVVLTIRCIHTHGSCVSNNDSFFHPVVEHVV